MHRILPVVRPEPGIAVLALLAACSSVPLQQYPAFADYQVEAEYRFDGHGPHRIAVPSSGPQMTVLELHTDPGATAETFIGAQRWILVPSGCAQFTIRCRYRDYTATEGGSIRRPEDVFLGAHDLRITP